METKKICSIHQLTVSELDDSLSEALTLAEESSKQAYAPYSEFQVGAAALLEDGTIVRGNNQENAAYPSGLCAERVTVFNAKANYDSPIVAIAISVHTNRDRKQAFAPPCGACLQVLSDIENRQENSIQILIKGVDEEVFMASDVKQFLPFTFQL